jgi:hypothetical protein
MLVIKFKDRELTLQYAISCFGSFNSGTTKGARLHSRAGGQCAHMLAPHFNLTFYGPTTWCCSIYTVGGQILPSKHPQDLWYSGRTIAIHTAPLGWSGSTIMVSGVVPRAIALNKPALRPNSAIDGGSNPSGSVFFLVLYLSFWQL